ncbi:MAG: signal peptidase I [Lachnospiraceae bacterium]|nr:signal peptidase I [Lachnospiraceae bacterium]
MNNNISRMLVSVLTVLENITLVLCFIFAFSTSYISGCSMEGTIHEDDACLINRLATKNLDTYDIIVFKPYTTKDDTYIKRIIATEGDTIEIKNNIIYVNSQAVDHSAFTKYANNTYADMPRQTVPEDSYFVLGDNRGNSLDSRDPRIGFIHESQIKAKMFINLTQLFGIHKTEALLLIGTLIIISAVLYIILCILNMHKPTQSSPAH